MKKNVLHFIRCRFLALMAMMSITAGTTFGQAFTENFDNITTLTGSGWTQQNNSAPAGVNPVWFQGNPPSGGGPFVAYNGADNSYIACNFNSTAGGTGTISNWLVAPNRTFRNGDVITFYTRKYNVGQDYPDRMEVRLSTNGASTNVGTGATAVGDFTTLLLSINPSLVVGGYPTQWTQYTITISGLPAPTSGRFAFRYFVTNAGPTGTNSDYIGLDNVVYTPYVCPSFTMTPGGALTGGVAGTAYNAVLTQTGALGAPNFAITAGALPPGLTLAANGTISGTPTATGTFNFTATVNDASGCSGSQSYSITVVCPPNPITFDPVSVCADAAPFALVAIPAGGVFSGTGVTGGDFDPAAGTQTVTYDYTDAYGCAHAANAVITVNALPNADAGADGSITCGGSAQLGSTAESGYAYAWLPVDGLDDASLAEPAAQPTQSTGYELTVTDPNGCVKQDSVYITVNPQTGTDVQNICQGSSYTFNGVVYTASNNTATDTFITAGGCDSIVTLDLTVNDAGIATASTTGSGVQFNDEANIADGGCELIGTVNSTADLGTVSISVVLGGYSASNVDPFVDRYYNIETTNPGGGTVTLYFTQQEIDDYNTLVAGNADYPQVGANGENLQITAFHSAPGSGTGPGGYDQGTAEVLACTPFWNAADSRWEVTFTTTAFSGFFLHTKADGSALPVRLATIDAHNEGEVNVVQWTSAIEAAGDRFIIERSKDSRSFLPVGTIQAKGMANSVYRFIDRAPFEGENYYRLQVLNNDGSKFYSKVVSATRSAKGAAIHVYPNPTHDLVRVDITGQVPGNATLMLTDVSGRVIRTISTVQSSVVTLDMTDLAAGIYVLKYMDINGSQEFKVVKK